MNSFLLSNFSGNFLVIAATCSTAIALTMGGIQFHWQSAHIIVPVVIGLLGLAFFIACEAILVQHPLVGLTSPSIL
jgi:hypothetical protein